MYRDIKNCLLWSSDERGDHAPASEARTSCGLKKWNQLNAPTYKKLSAMK